MNHPPHVQRAIEEQTALDALCRLVLAFPINADRAALAAALDAIEAATGREPGAVLAEYAP